MDIKIVNYLRECAQECIRISRSCGDLETSYALEQLAQNLMAKAAELEDFFRQC